MVIEKNYPNKNEKNVTDDGNRPTGFDHLNESKFMEHYRLSINVTLKILEEFKLLGNILYNRNKTSKNYNEI